MYESFYLRAVSPHEPLGVWIRNTVHKRPGDAPAGSVWCTVFDARRPAPYMHKLTSSQLEAPAGGWIEVAGRSRLGPGVAEGSCGEARWELRFASPEPPLAHLQPSLLYRTPLPRTKLSTVAPAARFEGTLELAGEKIELRDWPGMVGHNWGSEHAERWIWLHGTAFAEQPSAWLDIALARIRIGGRLTPWIATGALSVAGRRLRLGGLRAGRARVSESPAGCSVELAAAHGLRVRVRAAVPGGSAAGWRYADPDGGEHDVLNCSIAAIEVELVAQGERRMLSSAHGGAYELGVRPPGEADVGGGAQPGEAGLGVRLAPFEDGGPPER